MSRGTSRLVAFAVVLTMGLFACSCGSEKAMETSASPAMEAASMGDSVAFGKRHVGTMMDEGIAAARAGAENGLSTLAATQPDRYLIKNAWIQVEVDDASKGMEQLSSAARAMGGYLSNMHERKLGPERTQITATLRVPAEKFEQAMTEAQAMGNVIERRVSSDDVTEQYVDTEASIRNLKRTEERLLEHLDRSAKLEDILKAEQELTRVRGQLERLEGQLRFLSHRVAFSTIEVTLYEKEKAGPLTPVTSFSTGSVASRAVRSLVEFLQSAWVIVIWVGVWAPVWLLPVLLILYAWRKHARRRAQRP